MERKIGISAADTGDEVLLPCADGFFRWIIAVIVRRDELKIYIFKAHVSLKPLRAFVVHGLELRFEAANFEVVYDLFVCSCQL